jgi:phosphatidylserine/phosphatidylglycerophosphate/cardiolipin synthase-like enzyme
MVAPGPVIESWMARRRRRRALNRRHLIVALVAVFIIILVIIFTTRILGPSGAPAKVALANNRDYFPAVHSLLGSARNSIDVMLYQSRFYFQYPLSTSNTLIADLVDAKERGVSVRVIFEIADWNLGNSEDNRDVWNLLDQAGLETYFDPATTTSHSKLLVIDGRYSVVGSMNWSYYALDRNYEATAIIDSPEIAGEFDSYFDRVLRTCTRTYALPVSYVTAAEALVSGESNIFLRDVADSGRYTAPDTVGTLYLGPLVVFVDEDALEEMLAVDSLFFSHVRGDTLRIYGRVGRNDRHFVHAVDVEASGTRQAMAERFAAERTALKSLSVPKPVLTWNASPRVVPIPNELYAPAVGKLIRGARRRIWVAMLDARYYETAPGPPERAARKQARGEPPSLTNLMLADLQAAARRGVDVRLVIDASRDGRMPPTKTDFLDMLKEAGGKVFEDPLDVTTHAKVMIVDDDFTVVGSTNWSEAAVEENNETAVVIESPEINGDYAAFIEADQAQGTPYEPASAEAHP